MLSVLTWPRNHYAPSYVTKTLSVSKLDRICECTFVFVIAHVHVHGSVCMCVHVWGARVRICVSNFIPVETVDSPDRNILWVFCHF